LVEAFKATLEEAAQADFLLHLLDASAPEVMDFYTTTMKVLQELGAGDRPMLVVFNKVDRPEAAERIHGLKTHFPEALFISVHSGEGLPELLARMEEYAAPETVTRTWRFAPEKSGLMARLHRLGVVLKTEYDGADALVTASIPRKFAADLAQFVHVADSKTSPDCAHATFLQTTMGEISK
jgi:GTPase